MMKIPLQFAALLLTLLFAATVAASEQVSGIVYADLNGNGLRDRAEPGIAGVAVSNGRDVVRTDAAGGYRIGLEPGQTLFVVKPRDHQLPVDALQRPQFYRHHLPGGSTALRYGGLPDTGELPDSVDFALLPKADPETFELLLLGDPQPNNLTDLDHFRRSIIEPLISAESAQYAVVLGDLVNDDLDMLQPFSELMASLRVPWFALLGNHDLDFDAEDDSRASDSFRRHFGPTTYAVQIGNLHLLVLDTVRYQGAASGGRYLGGLRGADLTFVENYLAEVPEQAQVVVAGHIPWINEPPPASPRFSAEDRRRLFATLARFPNSLSLAAHMHTQRQHYFDAAQDWPGESPHRIWVIGASGGSFWTGEPDQYGIPHAMMADGTPRGWGVLSVDGKEMRTRYRVARRPADYTFSLHAPRIVEAGTWPGAHLWINVFMGSERTQVEVRIDEGEWQAARRVLASDPHILALQVEQDQRLSLGRGLRVPDPSPSTHIWRYALPTDLALGLRRVEVRVRDMYGDESRAVTHYRILAR